MPLEYTFHGAEILLIIERGVYLKIFLKIVLALILVIVLILAGLYTAISLPKKVDVTWTEKDVQSYMQKAHVNISSTIGVNSKTGTDTNGSSDNSSSGNTNSSNSNNDSSKNSNSSNSNSSNSNNNSSNSSNPNSVTIKPASLDDLMFDNFKSTGKNAVDATVTSSEATAMINTITRGQALFKDVRMKFRDDGTIEASCYLGKAVDEIVKLVPQVEKYKYLIKPLEGKPIYWRYSLERVNDKQFDAHTLELKVGQIPVPLAPARAGLTDAGSFLNDMVEKIDGFTCEQLSIDSQGFHFKGTLPKKLEYIDPTNLYTKQ